MFLNSCRCRASVYMSALQIAVSGMPSTVTSSRSCDGGSGLRRVVEEIAAGLDLGDVLLPRLRVHRAPSRSTPPRRPRQPRSTIAHLVPRRQALDVRREDVARRDRHAHAQDRLGEQAVRRRRARAVDVGELDDEVVDALDSASLAPNPLPFPPRPAPRPLAVACATGVSPACAMSSRNFCMSHAPVGQRSAHRPQCRHTSSSLTIDAAGLEVSRHVEVLREIDRRRLQARAQVGLLAVGGERDAVHRADVDARVALDAQLVGEHRLHVAVEAALRLGERELEVEAELDFDLDVLRARSPCP